MSFPRTGWGRWFAQCLLLPCVAYGHQLDEYVQGTLIFIEPQEIRLKINLTPGVAIMDQVLALTDIDHDGSITPKEAHVYAELLRRDLSVKIDGTDAALKITSATFPEMEELRSGFGIAQIELSSFLGEIAPGSHTLSFENRHLPAISIYLVNAAKPSSTEVHIETQKRSLNQSAADISFSLMGHEAPATKRLKEGHDFHLLPWISGAIISSGISAWLLRKPKESSSGGENPSVD